MPELVRQTRVDRLDQGLMTPHKTDDGFVFYEARVAKPGIMIYRNRDGSTRRELVPRSALHDADALGTLGHKPVTLGHPSKPVTPQTFKRHAVGHIDGHVEVEKEGGYVKVRLVVNDAKALKAIQGGTVEVSPGYEAMVRMEGGIDEEFGEYDSVQVSRGPYNHLAIVDRARGGETVRLRADAVQHDPDNPWVFATDTDTDTDTSEPVMLTKTTLLALIAGLAPTIAQDKRDSLADEILKASTEAKEDENPFAKRMKELEDENKALKGKLKDFEAKGKSKAEEDEGGDKGKPEKKDSLEERLAWARDRAALEAQAARVKIEVKDSDDNDTLRRAIVVADHGDDVKGEDAAGIRALWRVTLKTQKDAKEPADPAGGFRAAFHSDNADPSGTRGRNVRVSVADEAEDALDDQIARAHIAHYDPTRQTA